MSQHLAPNLKTKASPANLSRNTFFWAEHEEAGPSRCKVNLRSLNVHAWPCASQRFAEFVEHVRKVIPDIPEIPSCLIVEKRQSCRLSLKQLFILFNGSEDRDKADWAVEL